jgi:hypothetical protein
LQVEASRSNECFASLCSQRQPRSFLPTARLRLRDSRPTSLYPGSRNEAVLEPLRFSARDRRSDKKSRRTASGFLAAGQRNTPTCARYSLRERNGKTLVANQRCRFTYRMSGPNNAGSKLSASMTRQDRKRRAVPYLELGKVGKAPRCIPPSCRKAAPDTVPVFAPCYRKELRRGKPVSAPSASPPGFRQAGAFRCVEVRP